MQKSALLITATAVLVMVGGAISSVFAQLAAKAGWEQVQEMARKEGKLVLGIPASAELRQQLDGALKQKFGIEAEFIQGTPSKVTRRIADEYQAGVHYFDVVFSSADGFMDRLLPMGAMEPVEPSWVLPEVKDPKNWWGGHMWNDKAKRYAYRPSGHLQDAVWYNFNLAKAEELRLYNDLLNPKWKGKIGFFDPRLGGGAGLGMWAFLRENKGDEYLRRLVEQKLVVMDQQRTLAEQLANGRLVITIGLLYSSFTPFVKAGFPIKPLPPFKEGTYAAVGPGSPVILKNSPHPNAAKVFINWFLSKEGQEMYGKSYGVGSRRLDVDTAWMPSQIGIRAAKDFITVEEFNKWETQSEEKILTVRDPAREFANKILP
jgi:iron(III) transport system substrate-binding protein